MFHTVFLKYQRVHLKGEKSVHISLGVCEKGDEKIYGIAFFFRISPPFLTVLYPNLTKKSEMTERARLGASLTDITIRKCLTETRQNLFLILKRVLKGRLSSTYITLYKKDIQQLYFLKSGLKPSGSAQFSYYFAVSQSVPQFLESVTESHHVLSSSVH